MGFIGGSIGRDLRHGLRMLTQHPGSALLILATLGFGIGLTTAMYGIVHGAMADLPFEGGDRLIHLERDNPSKDIEGMEVTLHDYAFWQEEQTSFVDLAAFHNGTVNVSGTEGRAERYDGAFITPNAFAMLSEEPIFGRTFEPREVGPGAPQVVILGHRVWRTQLEEDPDPVGRTLRINGRPHTVIGVMAEGFRFPVDQDLWLPMEDTHLDEERGEGTTLEVFGRLRDGVTLEQAQVEMSTLADRLAQSYPETNEGVGAKLQPYTREFIGNEAIPVLYTMLAAVFAVLLVACVNVANLLLGRSLARGREVAIRTALGASRLRVIVQQLTEVFVLAALGTLLGLGLAALILYLFEQAVAGTEPPYWLTFGLEPGVLLFAAGLTLVATLAAGLAPAIRTSGADVGELLSDEGRGSSGRRMGRLSRTLVTAELALSCALLVGAGLMVQSIVGLAHKDYGVDEGVLTARLGLFEADYPERGNRLRFFEELEERLAAQPGVEAMGAITTLPALWAPQSTLEIAGESYPTEEDRPLARYALASPGALEALGVEVLAGRGIESRDREGAAPVALVNQPFVDRFFPDGDVVGQRIRMAGPEAEITETAEAPWRTVVGVVPDLSWGGSEQEDPWAVIVPLAQGDAQFISLLVAERGRSLEGAPQPPSQALVSTLRAEVRALDPNLPLYWVRSLEEGIAQTNWFYDVFGVLFLLFGLASLAMTATGLYGVMATSVAQRTREVGIRMALGAVGKDVLGMVLRQGAVQVVIGLALGLAAAVGLSSFLQAILFEVDPRDPVVYALVTLVLAATAGLAIFLPARRAARVDPLVAIRGE